MNRPAPGLPSKRRDPGPSGGLALAAASMLVLQLTSPGLAEDRAAGEAENQRLRAVERALEEDRSRVEALDRETTSLNAEVRSLQEELVKKGRSAQELEEKLSEVESVLARLEADEKIKRHDLSGRHAQLARTLGALQRIALQPPELALIVPSEPLDAVRSAMLLNAAVASIDKRAKELRAQLEELKQLRGEIAAQREALKAVALTLDSETDELAKLTERKETLYREASRKLDKTLERAAGRAAEAENLRGLVERLEAEALARAETAQPENEAAQTGGVAVVALAKPAEIRPFPIEQQSLVLPARGGLALRFGDRRGDIPGATSKGISVRTRTGAQVVAPYDGRIVYSGEFRGYGQILIIEHSGRYHSLLAGVERLNAAVGQWVLAGEPVGVMGQPPTGKPELYFELRRDGTPINPLPWLANIDDKVQG